MTADRRVGTRFGPYRIDALIGRGGMGAVYDAFDVAKGRRVALKLLHPELARSPEFAERFRRESRTAARISEPHVVPIHDWGEIGGVLYIDMRFVEGSDLRNLLRRSRRLSPERSVAIVAQIASALDAAHRAGLVHRDVKPDNILVTDEDFAYLADFGSLACVLYECLTGAAPFPAPTTAGIVRAHLMDPPPQPGLSPGVPRAFDAVVASGMAKNPAFRPRSAGELARAAAAALRAPRDRTSAWPGPAPTARLAHESTPIRDAPIALSSATTSTPAAGTSSGGSSTGPSSTAALVGSVTGADVHGFVGGPARCRDDDLALAILRTTVAADRSTSVVAICDGADGLYYRGAWEQPGNPGLTLPNVTRTGDGYLAMTDAGDRYEIRPSGLRVINPDGSLRSDEPAAEYAYRR